MISKREHTEIFITLILSWLVYAFCQGDFIVPVIAFFLVGSSYLKQIFGRPSRKSLLNLSWRVLFSIAIVLGGLWRSFIPAPDTAVSFIPILLPSLQTAAIVVAIMAWFSFEYRWRLYYLKFLPWLTVAASINVPFNALTQLVFWVFCFVSVGIVMGQLYFPVSRESAAAIRNSKYKSPVLYAYPVFLGVIALLVFSVLVRSIRLGDDIFMHLIQDYVGFRHFSLFDSTLNLNGAGSNLADVRPILEIDKRGENEHYLVGQVFEEYDNGVWKAPPASSRRPLPYPTGFSAGSLDLVMFEYLADIIPVPRGVVAMSSKGKPYEKDRNGIVFNLEKKIPKINLTLGADGEDETVDGERGRQLLRLSVPLAGQLKARVSAIIGEDRDPLFVSRAIEQYFRKNFQYNLYVDFRADDLGLLYMLDKKRPAYCSYFASAMALMLRACGIPSRVVGGFLATETSGFSNDKYVVRGRDAHAWVEAWLPSVHPQTGKPELTKDGESVRRWVRFDPTPADSRWASLNAYSKINHFADWLWYAQKRMKATILDIETKALVIVLFIVIIAIALEEVLKKVISGYKEKKQKEESSRGVFGKMVNPCWPTYRRFADYLKKEWRIERRDSETDGELIARLHSQPEIPVEVVSRMAVFLNNYHAARFGMKAEAIEEWPLRKIHRTGR